jgi:hypothetical protein
MVNRRQAYWRMFGFDLPHRMPAGVPGSTQGDEWKQASPMLASPRSSTDSLDPTPNEASNRSSLKVFDH